MFAGSVASPTATQAVSVGHETALRPLEGDPESAAVCSMAQLVPFHLSAKPPLPFSRVPTAVQAVAVVHDIPATVCAKETRRFAGR
jgi:hypothetical protein